RGFRYDALAVDGKLAVFRRHLDGVAVLDAPLENHAGQRVLQVALDHALERPRAVDRVVADVAQPGERPVVDLDRDLARRQQRPQAIELYLDDAGHVLPRQATEQQDLVDPVQELRTERGPHDLHDRAAYLLDVLAFRLVGQDVAAEIRRHD